MFLHFRRLTKVRLLAAVWRECKRWHWRRRIQENVSRMNYKVPYTHEKLSFFLRQTKIRFRGKISDRRGIFLDHRLIGQVSQLVWLVRQQRQGVHQLPITGRAERPKCTRRWMRFGYAAKKRTSDAIWKVHQQEVNGLRGIIFWF